MILVSLPNSTYAFYMEENQQSSRENINERKISSIFIDKDFQMKMMVIFGAIGVLQSALYYYAIFFSFKQLEGIASQSGIRPGHPIFQQLNTQEFYVMAFLGFTFIMTLLLFLFLGFRFSHRVAGSMYRMRVEFDKMAETKELHHIRLRKTDFFQNVEKAFNHLVDVLKKN